MHAFLDAEDRGRLTRLAFDYEAERLTDDGEINGAHMARRIGKRACELLCKRPVGLHPRATAAITYAETSEPSHVVLTIFGQIHSVGAGSSHRLHPQRELAANRVRGV